MTHRRLAAFTLVELVVVIVICAMFAVILIPLQKMLAEDAASTECLGNLNKLGQSFLTFAVDHHGFLPYPAAPLGDHHSWVAVISPFLRTPPTAGRLESDIYRPTFYTQCPLVKDKFRVDGDGFGFDPSGDNLDHARSYKMNANLRHWVGDVATDFIPATVAEVPHPEKFVMIGDGISLDSFGNDVAQNKTLQFDNIQLCMDVKLPNDSGLTTKDGGYTCPALRHEGQRCNIEFVDGHAESVQLPTITRRLDGPGKIEVQTFQGEFNTPTGQPAYLAPPGNGAYQTEKSASAQGLVRNPNMPLIWTDLPTLTHP